MKGIFLAALIAYSAVNILILWAFFKKGKKTEAKSVSAAFGLLWVVTLTDRIFRLGLPPLDFIFLMTALTLYSLFGMYFDLFHRSRTFDRLVHGVGAFSYAVLLYDLLSKFIRYGGSAVFRALYAMLLGISLGAAYEIYEFAADAKRSDKLQRGLMDTDLDLIFDVAGALCAAGFIYFTV